MLVVDQAFRLRFIDDGHLSAWYRAVVELARECCSEGLVHSIVALLGGGSYRLDPTEDVASPFL